MISKLPFDILKVDKSFVQNAGLKEDKNLGTIIISMAEILNMQTIVEGVKTREQVDYCKKMEGLFSKDIILAGHLIKRIS